MFPSKEENCIVVVNRKSSTEFFSDIEPLTQVVHITFKRAVTLISTPFVAFTLRGKKHKQPVYLFLRPLQLLGQA